MKDEDIREMNFRNGKKKIKKKESVIQNSWKFYYQGMTDYENKR